MQFCLVLTTFIWHTLRAMTSSKKSNRIDLLPIVSSLVLVTNLAFTPVALAWGGYCGGEGQNNFRGGEGGGCYNPCGPREGCEGSSCPPPNCGGPGPAPGPTPSIPPVVNNPTPPPFIPPPPVFVPPTSNIFPAHTPFLTPTDITNPYMVNEGPFLQLPNDHALKGIELLAFTQFPKDDKKEKDEHPIYVFPKPEEDGVQYSRVNPSIIDFKNGEVLVSVRKPAELGIIHTILGTIAIQANTEIILSYQNGVLRIINLDGMGRNVKIKLTEGPFADNPKVVSIKPGHELVIGQNILTRKDIRPRDGLARRHFQIMEEGHLAISELSVASILESSGLLADLKQSITGSQERRILGDMSKMASVLNYMNGIQGFSTSSPEHYGEKLSSKESEQTDE